MKALVLCAALSAALFGRVSAASASWHYDTTCRDLVRLNGQPRGDAAYQSDPDFCGRQTHATNKFAPDSAAFKQCMLGRNWRWVSTKMVQDPPAVSQRRYETYNGLEPVRVHPDPDAEGSVCRDYEPPGGISWTDCSNFLDISIREVQSG
jgi:hypothetical protein